MGLFFYRESPVIEASDGFEYINGWPGTIADITYPDTFSFVSPIATATDGFEYANGWPDTIVDINYPATFSFASPVATGTEDFESGWITLALDLQISLDFGSSWEDGPVTDFNAINENLM